MAGAKPACAGGAAAADRMVDDTHTYWRALLSLCGCRLANGAVYLAVGGGGGGGTFIDFCRTGTASAAFHMDGDGDDADDRAAGGRIAIRCAGVSLCCRPAGRCHCRPGTL